MNKSNVIRIRPIVWLAAIIVTSCGQRAHSAKYKEINPEYIKETLEVLDSARLALVDSDSKEREYRPEEYLFGVPSQESYDSSVVVWNTFVKLCKKDKFKEAYDYYNEEENSVEFIICLKHSTNQYIFYKDVLKPMMYEFEPKDSADVKYLSILVFEHYLGEWMIEFWAGETDYVPASFPDLTFDLGTMLAAQGQIDEALEMVKSFAYAVQGLNGNPAFTNFNTALYVACIYYAAGDIAQAIVTLEEYKEYTAEHKDPDRDPQEYESYCSYVDREIERMSRLSEDIQYNP